MIYEQIEIHLRPKSRGFHLITSEIEAQLDLSMISKGMVHLFLMHSSASLSINENYDPSVREDMEQYFNEIVPEDAPYFTHTDEGNDDMPAHIKSAMLGVSLTLPITKGCFHMGTWQGIYLNEHRNHGGERRIIATVTGV